MENNILQKEIKAQPLRLWDVFILAPFLLYAGTRKTKLTSRVKNFLVMSAVSIAVYELKNFTEIAKREKKNNLLSDM